MINSNEFDKLREELETYDTQRESLIKKSRDVVKLSKQVIYSVHRDDFENAQKYLDKMIFAKEEMDGAINKNIGLGFEGSFRLAMQEYVEAVLYYYLIKEGNMKSAEELKVNAVQYLLGICDLTGELGRKAVMNASQEKFEKVKRIKDIVSDLFGELLKFSFRDNELRRKFDSVKYDLKKLEDLYLDLKLKKLID